MARTKKEETVNEINEVQELTRETLIDVMNYTSGSLIYVNSRTQEQWNFEGFGTIQQIPFGELINIKASQPNFLLRP